MSSNPSRRPEFRLYFGYPKIILRELGRPDPVAEVALDDPAIAARLLGLGGMLTRAGGRLVAVLPEAEVWRGTLALKTTGPRARRAEARSLVAAELGLEPRALATVVGARDAAGRTAAAAVRRSTLTETRRFLRQARIRPAAIVGDGSFPGFVVAPRLDAPTLSDLTRRLEPALRPAPAAKALALSTACLALVFALTQRSAPPPTPEPTLAQAPVVTAAPLVVADTVATAPIQNPIQSPAPHRRPAVAAARPAPQRVAHAAPTRAAAAPILISEGTRNLPELAGIKLGDDLSSVRVAERIGGSTVLTDAERPMLRPAPAEAAVARSAVAAAAAPDTGLRPKLRPAATPAKSAALEPAAGPARPLPRPEAERSASAALAAATADAIAPKAAAAEPVRVASLTSTMSDATDLATLAASPPPEPRPDQPARIRHVAVKPKVVHATAKPVRQPAQVVVKASASPAPLAIRSPQPTPQQALWAPAPVAQQPAVRVVQQPVPQQVARVAQPAPQPVRTAMVQPATVQSTGKSSGLQRGNYALLGVFGSNGARHALVRLPSGAVRRVSAGDNLQGAQVAAVAADSVQLTGGGRNVVLKLE